MRSFLTAMTVSRSPDAQGKCIALGQFHLMTEKKAVPEKEEIEQEIKAMLEKESWCSEWFSAYNRVSWNGFIDGYARFKNQALSLPTVHLDLLKPKVTEFNEYAYEILGHIQQKKLFNLQCEWRAERIKLPGIEIAYDFELVSKAVLECPFIPPVTWEEVQVYIDFLQSPGFQFYNEYSVDWQDYDTLSKKDTPGYMPEEMPRWYEFYDEYFDTAFLMKLPDIRGDKEEHYFTAFYNRPSKTPPPPRPPQTPEQQAVDLDYAAKKPTLFSLDMKTIMDFARHFEDEETVTILQSHAKAYTQYNDFEELDKYYEYLKTMPENYPLVEADSWQDAIKLTVEAYKREHYIKALPRIWRQYRKKTGDDLEANATEHMRTYKIDFDAVDPYKMREIDVKRILGGRKALGEPENFDF